MRLNAGQQSAVDAITAGRSVFLTGEGGTGKSVALREAVKRLKRAGKQVVVCAPTGIAAQQIHGATIHSAFRFDLGPKVADALAVAPSKVIKAADTVIIDEVGMVRRDLMDAIARVIEAENERRQNDPEDDRKPLQTVVVGDFSQLPPVATTRDLPALEAWYGKGCVLYAFAADGWQSLGLVTHMLTEPMRQRGDDGFVAMLNRARIGDASCISYFNELAHRGQIPPSAISLVGTNRKAEEVNGARLRKLDPPEETYRGDVEGDYKSADMAAPENLRLRLGARVIIVANDSDGGYVNGSTGSVVDLHGRTLDGMPAIDIRLDNGGTVAHVGRKSWENTRYEVVDDGKSRRLEQRVTGRYTQYPVKLAWSITFHKSQGQTLPQVVIDPKTFAPGQLYVGLSRATSAAGIWLTREIRPKDLQADTSVVEFYRRLGWTPPKPATGDERPVLPAVIEDGGNSTPTVNASSSVSASSAAPLPTTMDAIMAELTRLLAAGGRAWARVYALMARVADEELYKPSWRSYSAWLKALAAQTGVSEGLLWHRRSAGDFYESWRDNHPEAPDLSDGKTPGLTEENLNIVRKIDKVAPERTDELMTGIMAGSTGTKDLRTAWRDVRNAHQKREREQEEQERDATVPVPSPSVVTDDVSMTITVTDTSTWEAVLDALRAAGLLQ